MKVIRFIGITSVLFYILCWFTDQPTKELHYVGIALPWLSLILSILIGFACKIKNNQYFASWGYVYAIATFIYVVAVSFMSGSILPQLPHLAACVTFIAYFSLEASNKK